MDKTKTIEYILKEKEISKNLLEDKLTEVAGLKKVNNKFLTKVLSLSYLDYKIMEKSYKEGQKNADKGTSFVIAIVVTIFFGGFTTVLSKLDFAPAFLTISIYALISLVILSFSLKGNGSLDDSIKIFNTIDILIGEETKNQPRE